MSICAPKPFGSKFLKGGYGYWPLWWYGQRSRLHDMSGHGNNVTIYGAHFDGQGYCFSWGGKMISDAGNRPLSNYTVGSWYSFYLTDDEVPPEGTAIGTGTHLGINIYSWYPPKLTGKITLYPEYCPNLFSLICRYNRFSAIDVSRVTNLEVLDCYDNLNISVLDVHALTNLIYFGCQNNNISFLDVSALTKLRKLHCHNNSMNQDMVDIILCDADNYGTSDGDLNISGNAAPSATGVACKNNLVSRGWTVTTD